jgi:hypothetical protein
VLKGLPLLLDEKEARRPASSPQLLPATRSRRLLHLLCETALYNMRLLLTRVAGRLCLVASVGVSRRAVQQKREPLDGAKPRRLVTEDA